MVTTDVVRERWLNCLLDKGMFSDEIAVTYPPEGQAVRSVFVPKSAVRGIPGTKGLVRVAIMRNSGATLAMLPSSQGDVLAVAEHDLSDAP